MKNNDSKTYKNCPFCGSENTRDHLCALIKRLAREERRQQEEFWRRYEA